MVIASGSRVVAVTEAVKGAHWCGHGHQQPLHCCGCNSEGNFMPRPELCTRALQPETSVFAVRLKCVCNSLTLFLIKFGFILLIDLDRLSNKQT